MQPFAYLRATSLADARHALAAAPDARLLAGGTTLYDLMKLGVEQPPHIIDINGVPELAAFDTRGPHDLVFGSLARMSDVAADPQLVAAYPALSESLWRAASQQLRNMASLGGNLLQRTRCAYFRGGAPFACNKRVPGSGCAAIDGIDRGHALLGASDQCIATYPGDWANALVAFDAVVDVLGPGGARTIAVEALHRPPGDTPHVETVLDAGDIITRIRVPVTALGKGSVYHKIRDRESYAFALASAAVAVLLDGDTVVDARIAVGGVATTPWRARAAEQQLRGARLTWDAAYSAGQAVFADARLGRNNGFRAELGARTVADAFMIAAERASA